MASSVNEPAQEPELMEVSSEEGDGETDEPESDESETKGPHLCKDLESILKENDLDAPGLYAYSSLLPFAPQACLNIEGLGRIGLPLSEHDEKRVIAYASQAAYGQGSETIVNKEVRDTWEIDASHVKFDNPNWLTYVQDLAVKTVCSSLRVKKHDTPPKCELYKLLIYETGSHFLPHRDSQKAEGMFATMIILLPSQYTGGEVHLTHGSKTQVIDFSASSLTNTAVLAWYTDVLHEVKPVTSGYRLALSYNLIYPSTHMSLPMAPTYGGACAKLRRVLHEWKKGNYHKPEECDYIAYLLKHQYSEVDFSRGASCLKGEDDDRVALVRAAADELGFSIFLAHMKYHVSGNADTVDRCQWPKRRRRCGSTESDYDDINEEADISISLSKMVDLNGHAVLSLDGSIKVDDDCFLPTDALDDESPDDSKEEYTGNEGTTLEYWYHRSVFVLMPSEKFPHVLMQNGEVEYVVKLFKESLSDKAPTEKDKAMAKFIISNLLNTDDDEIQAIKDMLDLSYKWKDIEMWQDLIQSCGEDIEVPGEIGLTQAWRAFGFDQIRASIEELLRSKRLPDRLAFINSIRQAASESEDKDVIQEWCLSEATVALTTYVSPNVRDVSSLVSMACEDGIQSICQIPIDKLVPEKAFEFLTALVKDLHPKQTVVLEQTAAHCAGSSNPQSEATRMLDEFIRSCLDCAGKRWNVVTSGPRIRAHSQPVSISGQEMQTHVLDLVELCLLTGQMDTCRAFLDRVWNVSGEVVDKFNKIYTPLLPELCKLLRKTNTDVCAAPFIDFFRLLISHYLSYVLRTKGQRAPPPKTGCGCGCCEELDDFLAGKQSQFTFFTARRDHLKSRVEKVGNLVIEETQPFSLAVTKTPAFLSASMWEYRLQVVNDMFKAIGTKNVETIMGDRYVDVRKALKGRHAFHLDETAVLERQQQNLPSDASTSTVSTTTSVIGGKRKQDCR